MSSINRHKKPGGFYKFVLFMETLDTEKRKKIFDFMREEDPIFVAAAEKHIFHWDEFEKLDPMVACEIVSEIKDIGTLAMALHKCTNEALAKKFIANIPPAKQIKFKQEAEMLGQITVRQQTSARMKMIETARELERQGKITLKYCPKTYEE